jgi:orotidine-5'-phosphate decarboxylase
MKHKIICIAIDKSDNDFDLFKFASQFPKNVMFKIGLEYFTKFGSKGIEELNHDVFLDLKFYDIPNTVAHAVKSACSIKNVKFLTIHAEGGAEMVKAAVEARNVMKSDVKIICVTKLTSQKAEIEEVLELAQIAFEAGADGVVCSAMEVAVVREKFGEKPIIITPGIRPEWYSTKDDQVRIATPKQAFADGSSIIVIGRPITQSQNPVEAYEMVAGEV